MAQMSSHRHLPHPCSTPRWATGRASSSATAAAAPGQGGPSDDLRRTERQADPQWRTADARGVRGAPQGRLAEVERLGAIVRDARLDTLIVVGDDRRSCTTTTTCRRSCCTGARHPQRPLVDHPVRTGPARLRPATSNPTSARLPGDDKLAMHLIDHLMDDEFDLFCADRLARLWRRPRLRFVHNRLLQGSLIPVCRCS